MFNTLLPQRIDNSYSGQKLAIWLFAVVVFVKMLQSVSVILVGDSIVRSADGIPLETYTPAAAQTVVAVFAAMGLSRLMISLLCVLVLVRYRSVITFLFALLALHDVARELILHPVRIGTPPGSIVNFVLFALTLAGIALSLWTQSNVERRTDTN